jgi:hypothetical protein
MIANKIRYKMYDSLQKEVANKIRLYKRWRKNVSVSDSEHVLRQHVENMYERIYKKESIRKDL